MTPFEELRLKLAEISHLNAAVSLMSWDQEVMMPKGGAEMRARHISVVHGLYHDRFLTEVGPHVERMVEAGEDGLSEFERLNLRRVNREYQKVRKLPTAHVVEVTRTCAEAFHAWAEAKAKSDFAAFEPHLSKIVDLKIREAEYLGYSENPYDALIDQHEPDMKASMLEKVFGPFKAELRGLLAQVMQSPQVDEGFLDQPIAQSVQMAWSETVLEQLGYDMNRGRQDVSVHPFTLGVDPSDVRITTRVAERDIREMLYGTIHEAGHAIYEQGLPIAYYGLPACEACSLGIHESQSRLWENNVGRSLEFWEHFFPEVAKLYPDQLRGRGPVDMFRAVNLVTPSLIRISADELSYHFHIILRFEIENALINRQLKVKDLPEAWNAKIKEYMGLEVPDNARGVLQDIHWSHGSIGYFPTYSLGSFYAAQFMVAAEKEMPLLRQDIRQGNFAGLKDWLNENIHRHGRLYSAEELCKRVTGSGLDVRHFIAYAKEKYGQVYSVALA